MTGSIGALATLSVLGPDDSALTGGATLVQLLLLAAGYVWFALALTAVFRKVGQPTWKAWVPVVNMWTLFELAGMKGWWAVVQAAAGIVVSIVVAIIVAVSVAAAFDAAFRGDAAAGGAVLGATVIPLILWLAYAVFVVVLQVRMLRGLGAGFGLGAGYTVLGVVLLPLWASLVGWGDAQWRGRPQPGLPPTPFAAAPAPAVPGPASPASVAPAPAVASPPAPASAFAPPPGGFAAPAPAPAAPPSAPVNANPWMPPAPAPAPVPASVPAPAADAAASDDLDEHTVLAAHRRTGASLRLPGGASVELRGDAAVLGRNPVAPAEAPAAQRVPIDDATRTVSKTHALLRREGGQWTITDLASTNGVFLGAPDAETEVTAPTPVTGRFLLGDAELHLSTDR